MELCERLGLPCYCNKEAWHYSRNKYDFKKVCRECGVPVAKDYCLSDSLTEEELRKVEYPVVVKPVDLSGNEGISYCHNQEELIAGYRYARAVSRNPRIIVEKMLVGREYDIHYAFTEGTIRPICLIERMAQPEEQKNIYSISTSCTNNVERFMEEMNPAIEKALRQIGCREGIAWVEMMLDQDHRFYALEMGYRFNGPAPDKAFPFLFGFDTEQWVLDYSLGIKHGPGDLPVAQKHAYRKCSCGYALWTRKSGKISEIKGFDAINQAEGISCTFTLPTGFEFQDHSMLTTISVAAEDIDDFLAKIDYINQTVSILDEEGEDVIIRFTDYETIKANYQRGQYERNKVFY